MKGWYIPARPDEAAGESTVWYASFWAFCEAYLRERFGTDWCLSPENSLSIHAGNRAIPRQLLIRSDKARNRATPLPHDTSIFDVRASMPPGKDTVELDGLRLYSLPAGLTACSPAFFENSPIDARVALSMVRDASDTKAH